MSDEKYSQIIEGLAELKGTTLSIREDLTLIKADVHKNTKDLEDHIAGVRTNQARLDLEIQSRNEMLKAHEQKSEDRFKQLDERLEIVEFLPNLAKSLYKLLKYGAAVASALLVLTKFFGLW